MCWTAPPTASQRQQLGKAARMKRPAREAACTIGLLASVLRKTLAADAEQAGQAGGRPPGADRGQHDVALTRRDGGHDGEEKEHHDLSRLRTLSSPDREASPDLPRG
jgi:hypothetical protein